MKDLILDKSVRKAIILAAGRNLRLHTVTSVPKTLLRIGAHTLLDRILFSCKRAKISRITIVLGYKAEEIERHLKENNNAFSSLHITFLYNSEYANKNNIYSFWLAREEMKEPFILFNSDVFFHERILDLLLNSDASTALMIDDRKMLGREEMKVIINNMKLITDISKNINPLLANGEYIGIARFSDSEAVSRILSKCTLLFDMARTDAFYEEALSLLSIDDPCIHGLSTDGLPWIEIDTPEDYEKAKTLYQHTKISMGVSA